MLERMKHGVIGAGPCGTLTALLLLEAGFEVVLFDVNDKSESLNVDLKSNLKLMVESSSPYDLNQLLDLKIESTPASFYRSKLLGGFSNVWGATWGSALIDEGQHWIRHYERVSERVFGTLGSLPEDGYDYGCDCFDFLSDSLPEGKKNQHQNFSKTQLAINPNICQCISAGETSCGHGSVWNSKSLLEKCAGYKGFSFQDGIDVTEIKVSNENVVILCAEKTYSFDGITVAAGPIGSSEILLNSFSNLESLEVSDTLMGYMPFFKYKLNSGHSGAFAFSQFKFDLRFNDGDLQAHVQLYAHSEIYLDRILAKLPKIIRPMFTKLAGFLLPHIGIALIYLDSKASSSLSISKGMGDRELVIKALRPDKSVWGLRRKIIGAFRGLKILPFVALISWAKPGESYHLGAGGRDLLDEYGFVEFNKRISVAGSLALPRIDPGPITHAAMAQSSRLVEKIIHQNFESS
jgi:hypothetical protein